MAVAADQNGFGRLDGRSAVVTGASSGIGRAIALELAAAGADVLVHARSNGAGLDTTLREIQSMGRRGEAVLGDLTSEPFVAELAGRASDWARDVHIWVNNAGGDVLTGAAARWTFDAKLDYLWQVDVRATIQLSRLVGQRMKERGRDGVDRCMLFVGWDQVEMGMAGDSGEMFSAIKGAVMAFSRSLARSLAPDVRVNCVAPGWIRTSWGDTAADYWQRRARDESLLQRWGTPEDVARCARYLVSPSSSFVTGQIVPINGGYRGSAGSAGEGCADG
jgi:3-oxoacyl-[acyl-carrier protein] reductase